MIVKKCDACGRIENNNDASMISYYDKHLCTQTCYLVVVDTMNNLFKRLKQENTPA